MPHLLAQLPPPDSAQAIGWLSLALFALFGGINQVLRLTDRFKEHPPVNQTYATKLEHNDLVGRVDAELGRERGARKQIHEQIAQLQADISAVKADNASQSRDLEDLKRQFDATNRRIDAIPSRTIALLNETKQLHTKF